MRDKVFNEARRWVGTTYHHHGRLRGQSCDCIGLIIGVGQALGFNIPAGKETLNYSALPHDDLCERMAAKYGRRVVANIDTARAGQIGLFWYSKRGVGQHFCVFSWHEATKRKTMIHAFQGAATVVETGISDFWRKRLIGVYDYKECADV